MQKKLVSLTTLVFLLMTPAKVLFASSTDATERTATICRDHPVIDKTKQLDGFKITIGHAGDLLCHFVEVKKQDRVLYRDQEIGSYFYFGANVDKEGSPFKHFTRDGHLNLVLSKWSGGAHCCFSLKIFDLDDSFQSVADIESGSFVPLFKDIDGDGIPEIEVEDDFLAYRFASFASSAIGHVVLKYRNGRYEVAPELMRKPPGAVLTSLKGKIAFWQKTLRHPAEPEFPHSFMQAITDLTFSGNKKVALNLIDRAWPKDRTGKETFVKDYEEALRDSRFYFEFEKRL